MGGNCGGCGSWREEMACWPRPSRAGVVPPPYDTPPSPALRNVWRGVGATASRISRDILSISRRQLPDTSAQQGLRQPVLPQEGKQARGKAPRRLATQRLRRSANATADCNTPAYREDVKHAADARVLDSGPDLKEARRGSWWDAA